MESQHAKSVPMQLLALNVSMVITHHPMKLNATKIAQLKIAYLVPPQVHAQNAKMDIVYQG